MTFFGKKKSSVKSYLNVECYRLNHVEKFSRRNQRMSGQCLKVFEKLEFSHKKKQIPSECYYGYVECIFHNLTDSFPLKAQNFCSMSLLMKIITFFKKRLFHRQNCVAARHAVFTTWRINFRQKAKTFAQDPKMMTKRFFSRRNLSIHKNVFLDTHYGVFKFRRNFLTKGKIIFAQNLKKLYQL